MVRDHDQTPHCEMTIFFVGWTQDQRMFQLLGEQEAESPTDAIKIAARTHQQEGRYIAMPGDKLTQRDVTFDMDPVLSRPDNTVASTDPTNGPPV